MEITSNWYEIDEPYIDNKSDKSFTYNIIRDDININNKVLSSVDSINFSMNFQEQFILLNKAFIEINLTVARANAAQAQESWGMNFGLSHLLFNSAKLSVNGSNIETINNNYMYVPLMKALLTGSKQNFESDFIHKGFVLDGPAPGMSPKLYHVSRANNFSFYPSGITTSYVNIDPSIAWTGMYVCGADNALLARNTVCANYVGITANQPFNINEGMYIRNTINSLEPYSRLYDAVQNTSGVPTTALGGDSYVNPDSTSRSYSTKIYLKDMFSFANDYRKVLLGHNLTIELSTNTNMSTMFTVQTNQVSSGDVTINSCRLFMPVLKPDASTQAEIYKKISKPIHIITRPYDIRSESFISDGTNSQVKTFNIKTLPDKLEYLICFMVPTRGATAQIGKSAMSFAHNYLVEARLDIGGLSIPNKAITSDFPKKQIHQLYQMFLDCCDISDESNASLSFEMFRRFYPMICFNLTTLDEEVFKGEKSVTLDTKFSSAGLVASGYTSVTDVNYPGAVVIPSFTMYFCCVYKRFGKLEIVDKHMEYSLYR
jgi:hypothetical protein